jgi:hypothetical protein
MRRLACFTLCLGIGMTSGCRAIVQSLFDSDRVDSRVLKRKGIERNSRTHRIMESDLRRQEDIDNFLNDR